MQLTIQEEFDLPLAESLRLYSTTDDAHFASFCKWLSENYDLNKYADIKTAYKDIISPKFLTVCWRTKRLMPIAKWLGWCEKRNLKTLDLGCGSGHMGLIANFFGHSNIGIDNSALFDKLRIFWKQDWIIHNIEAGKSLPVDKFDSITSILTNYGRNWTIPEWDDFIDRVVKDNLKPGGELVLHFPGNKILNYRVHLRNRASRTVNNFMFFNKEM